jgi:cobalt/nickel transport system permease protein
VKARIALVGYVVTVLLATMVHDIGFLALGLGAVLALSGRGWWRILRKACLAVLAFNAVVTLSYTVIALLNGTFSPVYVALINLRVLFLTCLTLMNLRLALKSRRISPPKLRDRYGHSATVAVLLLDKAMHNATEITKVMRSRGFFDD